MNTRSQLIGTEKQMLELAGLFSSKLSAADTVHLHGDLGAGKTTFVRGVLSALGCEKNVISPTFALVESYLLADYTLHHFDLYRLKRTEELEYIGFRDYFNGHSVIMIEWPERALALLPTPDYDIHIAHQSSDRLVTIKIASK